MKKFFLKKEWQKVLLLILFFLLLRFWPMLFFGKTMAWGDNYSLMVPGKVFLANHIKQGTLPLWNPEIFAGLPLINDINQSVLYFTTFFFALFPTALAVNLSIISHVVILMLGTYLLVKKITNKEKPALLAMLLMGLSTHASGSINNLSTIQSIVWFPWIAWMGLKLHDKKNHVFYYALLVLIHFLAGYPQHVIYAIVFSVILSALYHWKKIKLWQWLKTWLITAIAVLLVSAVAWLPFLEMLLDSTRMTQSLEQAQIGSLKPGMMIKLIFPYFFDKQNAGIKWGPSWSGQPNVFFYLGNFSLLILAVVFFDKKQRQREDCFYFIFVVSTILFSLGSYLPGFDLIQRLIPLFKFGRYPSMVLLLTNLAMVIWLASAFKRVKIKKIHIKLFTILWLGILILGLVWLYFVYYDFETLWLAIDRLTAGRLSGSVFHTLERDLAISKMVATNFVTGAAFALLSMLAFIKNKKTLAIILIGLDVLVHTQAMFYFAPKEAYQDQENQVFEEISLDVQHRSLTRNSNSPYTDYGSYWEAMVVRAPFSDSFIDDAELQTYSKLIHLKTGCTPNWNIVANIPVIHGYTTLLPRDFSLLWAKSTETDINFIDYIDPENPLLQDWAVKYYLVDYMFEVKEDIPFTELARQDTYVLYELPGVKARFRFANDQALDLIDFVENPNQISFSFDNIDQDYLLVADRYDRNWRAWINDQELEIENYNGMRRLKIEAGSNQLVMRFIPKTFYLGLGISGLSILVLVFLMITRKDE